MDALPNSAKDLFGRITLGMLPRITAAHRQFGHDLCAISHTTVNRRTMLSHIKRKSVIDLCHISLFTVTANVKLHNRYSMFLDGALQDGDEG